MQWHFGHALGFQKYPPPRLLFSFVHRLAFTFSTDSCLNFWLSMRWFLQLWAIRTCSPQTWWVRTWTCCCCIVRALHLRHSIFKCVGRDSVQMFNSKKVGFTCFLYIMMLIQSWCSWYNLDGRSEGGERCTCVVESVRSLANHHALINSSYGGDSIVSASITRIHHRITKIRQRCDINVQHSLELLGKTLISSALMQNSYHVMHGHDLACAIHARGCECM